MCYLCEAKGITGPQYRETQKIIAATGRWSVQRRHGIDWTKLPPRKLWKTSELKALSPKVTP